MLARKARLVDALVPALLLAVLGSCAPNFTDLYACSNPDLEHRNADGDLDPCYESKPAAACAGECVPISPAGWSEPLLLWHGAEGDEPECPSWAPAFFRQGRADLMWSPTTCLACECAAPTGTCAPPTKIAASSKNCYATGATSTYFDPPSAWAGECTQANAIPAGVLCNGAPCVESVTMGPLVLTEGGCAPSITIPPGPPPGPSDSPTWSTSVLECGASHGGVCGSPGEICAPDLPPPPQGFQVCIAAGGDHECFDQYPNRFVTYRDFKDERACTPCTCGAPTGSVCTGAISIYGDNACGAQPPVLVLSVWSNGEKCGDTLSGAGLASKMASPLTYTAGMCDPGGGEPTGSLQLIDPKTYCCRP